MPSARACRTSRRGIGGVATQALVNPYYGIDGVKLLREGKRPQEIIATLIAADDGRESRQLHIMDANGRIAAHTGKRMRRLVRPCRRRRLLHCRQHARRRRACSTTPRRPIVANEKLPFAQRLIAAMKAGEAAGGDKRGKQSAALLIHGEEEWSDLDLRVDDHTDPLAELERLEQVSRERWVHFRQFLPTRRNPAGITDRAIIDAAVQAATAGQS